MKNIWKEINLKKIVVNSKSISDCLRQLALKPLGSNYKTFKKYIRIYNIDTSHFLGTRHWLGKTRIFKKIETKHHLIESGTLDPSALKVRLIKENILPYKCDECGISSWRHTELVLHLDHINGINNDHRLENLRLLCPNCHSQTNTYCGRNNRVSKDGIESAELIYCIDCGKEVTKNSERCLSCAGKQKKKKIDWLPTSELKKLTEEHGFSEIARRIGVSDNAIRKRIKNHPND